MHRLSNLIIHSTRLEIRPVQEKDLAQILTIHSNPAVNRFIPYDTWTSRNDALAWYEYVNERRGRSFAEHFSIISKDDATIVGGCLAFDYKPNRQQIEIGYVLGEPYWGKGLMSEAMRAFVNSLGSTLPLSTLIAKVEPGNRASQKLLDKLDFDIQSSESNDETLVFKFHFPA